MQARLLLICLLVAAVSARQASLAQPTPHLVKKTIKLQPRQGLGSIFGGSSDSGSSDSGSSDSGSGGDSSSGTGSGSGSGSQSGSGGNADSSSSSSSSSASSPTSTTAAATSTSSSSSERPKSTSYQSTFTAPNSASLASTTNSAGSVVVVTQTLDQVSSTSTANAAASASQTSSSESSSGGHTGLIIGVSVVGGVAIIGALIFLYMKFGGKRFSDYQDEDADIKWPELKADGDAAALQPLPARRTGGAGFDMGIEFDDGQDGDGHSMTEYGNKGHESMSGSTTALNAGVGAGGAYGAGAGSAYGTGMEGTYHDENLGAGTHYSQPGVAGYYDPYSGYPSDQGQHFYPDQMHDGAHPSSGQQQYEGYQDYHNQSDPYAAARAQASSTSPQMQPYRVARQNTHQGF